MDHRWIETDWRKSKYLEKKLSQCDSVYIDLTWILNCGLCTERPGTNCLNHGLHPPRNAAHQHSSMKYINLHHSIEQNSKFLAHTASYATGLLGRPLYLDMIKWTPY
jgi:hypothetical protein